MTAIQIIMQVIMVGLGTFGVASLVEIYKKKIRKDNAKPLEIRLVSAALSIIAAIGFKVTGLFLPIVSYFLPNVTVWVDVAIYAVVIWVLQLQADMKILKALIKFAASKISSKDALTDEIKRLIKEFSDNTKIDIKYIVFLCKLAGITESDLETLLEEVGVDEEKAKELVDALKDALK